MLVPKSFLEDIRARTRLSDIIGKRIKLTRAGREFKACCPFHNEKSPSFYVNDDKGFYHCFGCGAHGDQIGFITRHDNRNFMDAVEELAALAGLSVPKPSPQEAERANLRDRLVTLMDKATQFFTAQLEGQKELLAYLEARQITEETRNAFRLGYAPENGATLSEYLKSQGFTDYEMQEAGLFRKSDRGGAPYAFFRDRLMFPVTDRRGRTIAFGARQLPESMRPIAEGAPKPPKYINSTETPLFQKGHILYNESHARTAAAKGNQVIVCEGYADVIAMWQAGFTGTVAPLGTALTDAQILSLWAMTPESDTTTVREPILCFDGDNAGRRAALRAMNNIIPMLQSGKSARFAFLPSGQDPDDVLRKSGSSAIKAIIEGALPLSDMIWLSLTQGHSFDLPEARAALQKRIDEITAQIPDLAVQKHYRSLLRDRLYKSFSPQRRAAGTAQPVQKVQLPNPATRRQTLAARIALSVVLIYPSLFCEVEETIGRMQIDDSQLDALRQKLITHLIENPDDTAQDLQNNLNQQGFKDDILNALDAARTHGIKAESLNTDDALRLFNDVTTRQSA